MKRKLVVAFQIVYVFVVLLIMFVLSEMTLQELRTFIFSELSMIFFSLMIIVEVLRSIRLKIVTESLFRNGRVSLGSSILSRFVANLASLFTPSSIGGIPAQSMVLSSRLGYPIEVFIGSGLIISMIDAILAALLNIALFLLHRGYSIMALLSSITIAFLWIIGIYIVFFRESTLKRIFERLYERFSRLATKASLIDKRVLDFREGVRLTVKNPIISAFSFLIGFLSFLIIGFSICFVSGSSSFHDLLLVLSIGGYTHVLSVFPTPGGSGFYEIGLAETLGTVGALRTRILMIMFYLLSGSISFFVVTKDYRRFVEGLKKSILFSENIENQTS